LITTSTESKDHPHPGAIRFEAIVNEEDRAA
jgi:hypothetical protein